MKPRRLLSLPFRGKMAVPTTVRPPQGLLIGRRVPCRRRGVAVGRRPEAMLPGGRRAKEGRAERRWKPAEWAHGGAQLAARLHARRVRSSSR